MSFDLMADASTSKQCRCCGKCESESTMLMRCARCRSEVFCSRKCQRVFWPFHQPECNARANKLADALEDAGECETEFTAWMREHNKQAVIFSAQAERLARGTIELSNFFGQLPQQAQQKLGTQMPSGVTHAPPQSPGILAYAHPAASFGQRFALSDACGLMLQWQQSMHDVHVLCEGGTHANITRSRLQIANSIATILDSELFDAVNVDESYWVRADCIGFGSKAEDALRGSLVEIVLSKQWQKGRYKDGTTNADTFWHKLFRNGSERCTLPSRAPVEYYFSHSSF